MGRRQWSRATKISVAIGSLPFVLWIGFQIFQEVVTWTYPLCAVQGQIVDTEGRPISGVKLVFRASEPRMWLPIIYTPTYRVHATYIVTTDCNGWFEVKWRMAILNLTSLQKQGYAIQGKLKPATWSWGFDPKTKKIGVYKVKYIMYKTF